MPHGRRQPASSDDDRRDRRGEHVDHPIDLVAGRGERWHDHHHVAEWPEQDAPSTAPAQTRLPHRCAPRGGASSTPTISPRWRTSRTPVNGGDRGGEAVREVCRDRGDVFEHVSTRR